MASPFAARMAAARQQRLNPALAETMSGQYFAPKVSVSVDGLALRIHRADVHSAPGKVDGTSQEIATAKIYVEQSQLTLTPQKGGRFVVNGVTVWTIENAPTLTNLQWCCNCKRVGLDSIASKKAD